MEIETETGRGNREMNLLVSANDNPGQYALQADGGIHLASQKNGMSSDGRYAGRYKTGGSFTWKETPSNGALNGISRRMVALVE